MIINKYSKKIDSIVVVIVSGTSSLSDSRVI